MCGRRTVSPGRCSEPPLWPSCDAARCRALRSSCPQMCSCGIGSTLAPESCGTRQSLLMPSRRVRSRRSWAMRRVIHCCRRMPPDGVRRCACRRPPLPAVCSTASSMAICSTRRASSSPSRSAFARSMVRSWSRGSAGQSASSQSAIASCSISCGPPSRPRCRRPGPASGSFARSPSTRRRARPSYCSMTTVRSSTRVSTPSAGWPSISNRPSTPAGCPRPSPRGSLVPPRPPLVSVRDGRRLTVQLLPGDPHALLLEEEVASFRPGALVRLGLTPRETEVLCAARAIEEEADIAWELCLSLHAVRDRLAHLEAKLGVHTAADAVSRALRESS